MNTLCACGCGQPVNTRRGIVNKFISGHNKARQKPPAYLTCIHCGTKKQVSPYLQGRPFCSTKCRDEYRKARKSEDHPQYKRIEQICRICGKTFHIAHGRVKRNIRYCSTECGNEARARRLRKDESDAATNCLRKRIAERDEHKCMICGFSFAVEVHHIIPRSEGGTHKSGNLITLCPNHHAMAHKGFIEKEELLKIINNNKN